MLNVVLKVFKVKLPKYFVVIFERIQYRRLLFLIATLCKYLFVVKVCLGYSQLTERHMTNMKICHFFLKHEGFLKPSFPKIYFTFS